MRRKQFKKFLCELSNLTPSQKRILASRMSDGAEGGCASIVESRVTEHSTCPHCQAKRFVKWGKSDGLQRYKCRSCERTFNALTGSTVSRLRHKDQWLSYCRCMNEGMSLRKTASYCGIDLTTAFRWRHRFLANPSNDKDRQMLGIVEADETFFTESCKGNKHLSHRPPRKRGRSSKKTKDRIAVLVVRDRVKHTADFVLENSHKEDIHRHMTPLLKEEVVLCSDGNNIYQSFAKEQKILHKRIVASNKVHVIEKVFHIQNVNAYIRRLKEWMRRFHGVATKYLANYLGWRRLLEKNDNDLSERFCLEKILKTYG